MYWEKSGPENTEATVDLAVQTALTRGIRFVVVASNSGYTLERVLARAGPALHHGLEVVGVTHHVGFEEPGYDEMPAEIRQVMAQKGVPLLTTTHLLAGIDRAFRLKFGGLYPAEIVAAALRLLGQGVKVGVEIAVMALDAGLIPYGQEVIAIAGTGRGADTAIVVLPAHAKNFFDTKVLEIICKPRL